MLKKTISISLFVMFLITFGAIKANSYDDPSTVVRNFYEFISAGDVTSAYDLISNSAKSNFESHGGASFLLKIKQKLDMKGYRTINVIKEDISEKNAKVTVEMLFDKSWKTTETLVLESLGWRIKPSFTPRRKRSELELKVSEVILSVSSIKADVTELYHMGGRILPTSSALTEMYRTRKQNKYIKGRIEFSRTHNSLDIFVTIDGKAIGNETLDGKIFVLSPVVNEKNKSLSWRCDKSTIPKHFAPGCW